MSCVIPSCERACAISRYTGKLAPICDFHWGQLTLAQRRAWWKDIDYGKKAPSEQMVEELRRITNDS